MRRAILGATLAAALALVGATGQAQTISKAPEPPWTITASKSTARVEGVRLRPITRSHTPTLAHLWREWGPPTSRKVLESGVGCRAWWSKPGLWVAAANFGLRPNGVTACAPRVGRVQEVSTLGNRWRTAEGLAVDDDVSRLRALYPGASSRAPGVGAWLLFPRRTRCIGFCQSRFIQTSNILALARSDRVRQFVLPVGAAGE